MILNELPFGHCSADITSGRNSLALRFGHSSTHMLMADAIYAVISTSLAGLSRIIESKLNNHEDWAPVRRVPPAELSPTDRVEEAPAVGPACIHWVTDATSFRFWARRIGTAISSNNRQRGLRIDMRAISSG